jgi:hypothetical protein
MCIGLCIVVINEEEPTRCYLVFYYTYDRLNKFRAALCPSSAAHDYLWLPHGPLDSYVADGWQLGAGRLAKPANLHPTANHQQPIISVIKH